MTQFACYAGSRAYVLLSEVIGITPPYDGQLGLLLRGGNALYVLDTDANRDKLLPLTGIKS